MLDFAIYVCYMPSCRLLWLENTLLWSVMSTEVSLCVHILTILTTTHQYIVYASACAGSLMFGSFSKSCIPCRIWKQLITCQCMSLNLMASLKSMHVSCTDSGYQWGFHLDNIYSNKISPAYNHEPPPPQKFNECLSERCLSQQRKKIWNTTYSYTVVYHT